MDIIIYMTLNFNSGAFGGHHLGGSLLIFIAVWGFASPS